VLFLPFVLASDSLSSSSFMASLSVGTVSHSAS
jgi:hypothetical protein